jgi:competence protein ComEC
MRAWWCGFALGVIWLQRQAALPDWRGWWALVSLGCIAILVAAWGLGHHASDEGCGGVSGEGWNGASSEERSGTSGGLSRCASVIADAPAAVARSRICRIVFSARVRSRVGWSAVWIAAFCVGFGYAAWRAETRLAVSLPSAWEGRDIDVVGSIKGLPSRDDKGARFLFNVESAEAPIAAFPRVIQLSWIAEDAPAPLLEPGERWRLTVRLKRPHGNANFGVRDAEAGLLARNVRATGYVSAPAHAVRLPGSARGVSVTVDRWRAALRARIDTVLADAPHRGIVVALAIGAQDEVSAADWLLMRGTGTSHLVATLWS